MSSDATADTMAITGLLTDYATGIDRRDFDLVASVFAPDARLDYSSPGGPVGTRDEVVAWLRTMLAAVAYTQHLLANVRVEVDGDRARAHAELFNPLITTTGQDTLLHLLGGRYDDDLVRTPQGWLIQERVHTTAWSAGPFPAGLIAGQE